MTINTDLQADTLTKRKITPSLAPNHRAVFTALRKAGRPMTAYQLIDAVRPQGISAPPTVYRALDRLIAEGQAHRLESLNAFVACTHDHPHSGVAIFMLCEECGEADEITDQDVAVLLEGCAHKIGFQSRSTTIEMRGHCTACVDQPL
ncbi:MAG TPA: Fur family transcriptional regulator [Rhodospirillales bacterium]|nr:Fur family transcriptional regulator [Rhodospirillales bacterium]